jgi:predicted nucleotidyltransferase
MIDTNIQRIKEIVLESTKDNFAKLILFGSRARQDFREDSDYDFLVVLKQELERETYLKIYSELKKRLAKNRIPNDFLIHSLSDIKMLSQVPGTTTYNAILEGIVL